MREKTDEFKMMRTILMVVFIVLGLLSFFIMGGCAARSSSIAASYVSHEKFTGYTCQELASQMVTTNRELDRTCQMQNDKATGDAWGVFLIGVPFSQLSGDYAGEVARLKGEVEAIETAQKKIGCM